MMKMTDGIRKRSFESWVHRRQINLVEWLKNKQIVSLSHLTQWCNENGLVPPTSPGIFALFVSEPPEEETKTPDRPAAPLSRKKVKTKRTKKTSSKEDSSKEEAWHTPAAERPRRGKKRASDDPKKH